MHIDDEAKFAFKFAYIWVERKCIRKKTVCGDNYVSLELLITQFGKLIESKSIFRWLYSNSEKIALVGMTSK